jgi:hypothetical protein
MEQVIIESCIKRRQPLPEAIANAPTIHRGLEPYYVAFWELSTCRGSGFGAGPIPWLAINEYADREGWAGERYEDLVDFVRALDRTFLAYQREKEKEKADADEARRHGPISQTRMVRR